jgi:hypothetical protein
MVDIRLLSGQYTEMWCDKYADCLEHLGKKDRESVQKLIDDESRVKRKQEAEAEKRREANKIEITEKERSPVRVELHRTTLI